MNELLIEDVEESPNLNQMKEPKGSDQPALRMRISKDK